MHNLGDSLGSFIRGLNNEIINEGLTVETFGVESMKPEMSDLFDCYTFLKEIFEENFAL